MISWKAVYARCRDDRQFAAYFTRNGKLPRESDFDLRCYVLPFDNVPGSEEAGEPGPLQGPLQQTFDRGAIVIGVTAGVYVKQQTFGDFDYSPMSGPGGRDLVVIYLARTDDEAITSAQSVLTATTFEINQQARVLMEAVVGCGIKDIFPNEILIAPGQSISAAVASILDIEAVPLLTTHVAFHAMIPRGD